MFVAGVWLVVLVASLVVLARPDMRGDAKAGMIVGFVILGAYATNGYLYGD